MQCWSEGEGSGAVGMRRISSVCSNYSFTDLCVILFNNMHAGGNNVKSLISADIFLETNVLLPVSF